MKPKASIPGSFNQHIPYAMILALILGLILTGCLPAAQKEQSPTLAPSKMTAVTQSISPTSTPVLALSGKTTPPTFSPARVIASPIPDPLRFTFPTTNIQPVTIWRPPLYQTPWEPTPHDHFYFTRPIGANEINWPLANYRYGGVFFENTQHTGVDIPAPKGTPVMAAGPGRVIWAGYGLFFLRPENSDPYGKAIAIKHDFGYQGKMLYTVYGHLDDYYVVRGQQVNTGDKIGIVGETGKVTGPHLHFEVRIGDNTYFTSRNPELWLAPPQGWGILAARVMYTSGELLPDQVVNIRSVETNQYWYVITYGGNAVNSDEYYQENMVIGDLPGGKYVIWIEYDSTIFDQEVEIFPGMVTYFTFRGKAGYKLNPPPTPEPDFIAPDAAIISTP